MGEHWGAINTDLNPDLNDIEAHYAGETFLVAWLGGQIVGSGALIRQSEQVAEIVRMSVATDRRRRGIGQKILKQLCREAAQRGFRRIVLETTSTWHEVIEFYRRFGFCITHHQDGPFGGEVYFALDLEASSE